MAFLDAMTTPKAEDSAGMVNCNTKINGKENGNYYSI